LTLSHRAGKHPFEGKMMNRTAALSSIFVWFLVSALASTVAESGQADGPGMTANTTDIRRKLLDLPYASASSAQMLDICLPDNGQGPFPVILQIHSGAFVEGDKRDSQLSPVLPALDRG
jgi:acetyl esterase/lipase